MKIDFTEFTFIAKTGEGEWYFLGETKLISDCND
jgi:hypothetical protein